MPLYNHQIPPGAADVVHYRLDVPADVSGPVDGRGAAAATASSTPPTCSTSSARSAVNDLPILTLAEDRVTFPRRRRRRGRQQAVADQGRVAALERLRHRPAAQGGAEDQGRAGGRRGGVRPRSRRSASPTGRSTWRASTSPRATVQDKAVAALRRAARFDPKPAPWTLAWLTGLVDKQNGNLDEAIAAFSSIVAASGPELRERGFDFSKDYNLLNELARVALRARAAGARPGRARRRARRSCAARSATFERTLALDPENVDAHYNLGLLYLQLGRPRQGARAPGAAPEVQARRQRPRPRHRRRPRARTRPPTTRPRRSSSTTCSGRAPSSSACRRARRCWRSATRCARAAPTLAGDRGRRRRRGRRVWSAPHPRPRRWRRTVMDE